MCEMNYFTTAGTTTGPDLSAEIETLCLTPRAYNVLVRGNVKTLGDLAQLSEEDLLNLRCAGRATVAQIIEKANDVGIRISTSRGMREEIGKTRGSDDKAWDVAAALFGCSDDVLDDLFGTSDRHYIVLHYSPEEVESRILNIQPLLDVGDEVHYRYLSSGKPKFGTGVIIFVAKDRYALIDEEGCFIALDRIRGLVSFEATGKHFDDPNEYVDWGMRAGVTCSVNGRVDWTIGPRG